jgi:hypothetical protein
VTPAHRGSTADDPHRTALGAVRRALFRLHKTLIDSERRALERERGSLSGGEFLQALIHDPAFRWLQPFTGIIVEIDEALASDEGITPEQARGYILRARELVEPVDAGVAAHYAEVRQSDPDVLVAHVELTGNIRAALG